MDAFIGLLKKEWKVSRLSLFIGIAIVLAIHLIAYFIGLRYEESMFLFVTAVVLLLLHVIYISVFFGMSLHSETKHLQLWLHTPQRITSLVTAKLIVTIIGYMMSFVTVAITTWFSYQLVKEKISSAVKVFTFENFIWSSVFLFLASISLGIFILFWTAINLWQRKYITRFRGLTLTLMIFALFFISSLIEQSTLIDLFTNWGPITLPFAGSFLLTGIEVDVGNPSTFYLGDALYEVVITIFLFFFSCYLLDKRVEV